MSSDLEDDEDDYYAEEDDDDTYRTKIDKAWATLFDRLKIVEHINKHGVYEISSKEINVEHQARLMTKFDYHIQLPKLFKKYKLTIQPNSRGTYLLGQFKSYHRLPVNSALPIVPMQFPPHIETINPEHLRSEAAVLFCAQASGMIADVLNDDTAQLTVQGRMSTGQFSYYIDERGNKAGRRLIAVKDSQCEIDSGFEGQQVFAIFEAKRELPDDFLVRQLYYPYRLWAAKARKQIVPIYLSYFNDVFTFYVFRFRDENHYNSIELVGQRKYQIVARDIELDDVIEILERARIVAEPELIPFPQADSFARVIDLLTKIYDAGAPLQQDFITSHYAFNVRQTQYYTNAAAYLGLVKRQFDPKNGVSYSLTPLGRKIIRKSPQKRNLALVERILEHKVFNETLRLYRRQAELPTVEQVVSIMEEAQLKLDEEGTTVKPRRAKTVLSWIKWMMELTHAG